jgi:acetyltransferase-like isoleucine patch superfamily enzyme
MNLGRKRVFELLKSVKKIIFGNYNNRKINFQIDGKIFKHESVSIGEGCNIIVFKDGCLEIGENCYIGRYVELGTNIKITIKDYTSIQDRCIILGDVTVGRYCLFAPNVYISSGFHSYDLFPELLIKDQDKIIANNLNINNEFLFESSVVIEDDCWLGINVVVMKGITIHKGCVVGANSVVTRDIPPYSVAVGSPAHVIKKRINFSPKQKIYWNNTQDIPYFYSDFLVSQQEMEEFKVHDGLVAKDKFIICLKNENIARNINIIAKSISTKICNLKYKSHSVSINAKMQQYSFKIEKDKADNFFAFNVISNIDSSVMIAVQAAWID